jgi:hypothetical protein
LYPGTRFINWELFAGKQILSVSAQTGRVKNLNLRIQVEIPIKTGQALINKKGKCAWKTPEVRNLS